MVAQPNPKLNHLLSVLPPDEWSRIAPELVLVDMPLGHVVYESGDRPEYVYFPITAIVSLLYVMENGSSGEIAMPVGQKKRCAQDALLGLPGSTWQSTSPLGGMTSAADAVQPAMRMESAGARSMGESFDPAPRWGVARAVP